MTRPPTNSRRNRSISEDAVVKSIITLLKKRGAYTINVHGSTYGRRGVPDLIACYRGRFVAIEAKRPDAPDTTITALQRHELRRIQNAGGAATVARDADKIRLVLDAIDNELGLADRPYPIWTPELGAPLAPPELARPDDPRARPA